MFKEARAENINLFEVIFYDYSSDALMNLILSCEHFINLLVYLLVIGKVGL